MPIPKLNEEVVYFGESNFRNKKMAFGIKMDDRRRHMYIIGKTGMGKSELLKNLAIQDIQAGRGIAFVDPHGDPVEDLFDYIPEERIKDVIYINPFDIEHPVAFNILEQVGFDKRHLVADGILAVFKKLWVDQWSARMEYILNYTILALLESPGSTLMGINRMMADKEYRKKVVENVTDSEVRAFWVQEFAKYTDKFATEATAAIQNKIGQFVSNPLIRNIIGQEKSSFDMRQAMDDQKIILINISKGRIGEDASRLLGALMITRIQLSAMSRVDIPKNERKDFILIVDEFQNFATGAFANILSEARKFNLSLVIAHQYVAQMEEEVSDAVFGNVGTIISFRVGAEDAELLEKEFSPEFVAEDIVNLGKRDIYLKLMIDGVASRAFSAVTMDTLPPLPVSLRESIVNASRATYGRNRKEVEEGILKWREPTPQPERLYRAEGEFNQRKYQPEPDYRPRERSSNYQPRTNMPPKSQSPISLNKISKSEPVDFKGKVFTPKSRESNLPTKAKPEVDLKGLHDVLEETMSKNKKDE